MQEFKYGCPERTYLHVYIDVIGSVCLNAHCQDWCERCILNGKEQEDVS